MIVEELVTLLKFDTAGIEKAQKFDKVLDAINDKAKGVAAAIGGAIASVGYFAQDVASAAAENYQWAKSVGVAADTYQRFEQVAAIFGGNLADMKDDLQSWARFARKSGLSIEDLFLQEAKRIEGMTNDVSYAYLKRMGYQDNAIKMIQLGEEELRRQFQQTEVVTEESLKQAHEYSMAWRKASNEISVILRKGVIEALPLIKDVVLELQKFIAENKDLIRSSVKTFFEATAIALKIMLKIAKPVLAVLSSILKVLDKAAPGWTKYALAIGMVVAALLTFAAVVFTYTVKAINALINAYEALSPVIRTVIKVARPLVSVFRGLFAVIKLIPPKVALIGAAFVALAGVITGGVYLVVKHWETVKGFLLQALQLIKSLTVEVAKLLSGGAIGAKGIETAVKSVVDVWNKVNSEIANSIDLTGKFKNLLKQSSDLFSGGVLSAVVKTVANISTNNPMAGSSRNIVSANAAQVSNSKSIVINNNNTINTNTENGASIANYLKQSNDLQRSGFGMAGAF